MSEEDQKLVQDAHLILKQLTDAMPKTPVRIWVSAMMGYIAEMNVVLDIPFDRFKCDMEEMVAHYKVLFDKRDNEARD